LAEVKKAKRERDAYPVYRKKLLEEAGDSLWYYIRLVTVLDSELLSTLDIGSAPMQLASPRESIFTFLELGEQVGSLLAAINNESNSEIRSLLLKVWGTFVKLSRETNVSLQVAAVVSLVVVEIRFFGLHA
jgi:hypothetical protein